MSWQAGYWPAAISAAIGSATGALDAATELVDTVLDDEVEDGIEDEVEDKWAGGELDEVHPAAANETPIMTAASAAVSLSRNIGRFRGQVERRGGGLRRLG